MASIEFIPEIPAWLLDDTEESVLGTQWHQEATGATGLMLRAEADRRGAGWGVCEQVELSGLPGPGGKPYNPRPDVMVLRQPIAGHLAAVPLSEVGAPLFVAEIASTWTVQTDLEGKRIAYAVAGIPEYLVFDPAGTILASRIMAWRLPHPGARVYVHWLPEPDGSFRSETLDVWFVPDPPFLRVRGNDGRLLDTPLGMVRRARWLEERAALMEEHAALMEKHATLMEERATLMEEQVGDLLERVDDLEERNRQLEAELERLRRDQLGGTGGRG
jgi:Uma2 family endonuclease